MTSASGSVHNAVRTGTAKHAPVTSPPPMSAGEHCGTSGWSWPRREKTKSETGVNDAKSEKTPLEIPYPVAPRARLSPAEVAVDLPAMPGGQDASPRLPQMRLLQGSRSHRRQGSALVEST